MPVMEPRVYDVLKSLDVDGVMFITLNCVRTRMCSSTLDTFTLSPRVHLWNFGTKFHYQWQNLRNLTTRQYMSNYLIPMWKKLIFDTADTCWNGKWLRIALALFLRPAGCRWRWASSTVQDTHRAHTKRRKRLTHTFWRSKNAQSVWKK